ncbi:MAG: hypothetical protein JWO95_2956, partial [Verrucomicrobiales bacterium]|nr:hypothetical protein [Verrucomicrobiales bacterium]
NPDVLNDCGIDAGRDDGADIFLGLGKLVRKNQRIESDITLHSPAVQKLHQLRQLRLGKVVRPHARIEAFEAEVDGVGSILHRRFGAFPIAGRGEQFRDLRPDCGCRAGGLC